MDSNAWRARAETLPEDVLERFREQVCVSPHEVTRDIGKCKDCGQQTSSGMAHYCRQCRAERGVCAVCLRKQGWGSRSTGDRDAEALCWVALALRGGEEEQQAATSALLTFQDPELLLAAAQP